MLSSELWSFQCARGWTRAWRIEAKNTCENKPSELCDYGKSGVVKQERDVPFSPLHQALVKIGSSARVLLILNTNDQSGYLSGQSKMMNLQVLYLQLELGECT